MTEKGKEDVPINFWKIESLKELEKLEKFNTRVKPEYKRLVNPHFKGNGYKSMWADLQKQDPYFKSPEHRLTYGLLHLDGIFRTRLLGLDQRHIVDKALLKQWYHANVVLIHEDKKPVAYRADEAFKVLKSIYEKMK
jgi:hypothetical protein